MLFRKLKLTSGIPISAFAAPVLVWLLVSNPTQAQSTLYHFNHLGQAEGLSSGQSNHYVYRDGAQRVWVSSTAGLNRFDGHRVWQYHRGPSPRSLPSEEAGWSDFCEDAAGRIWFTFEKGLTRYSPTTDSFATYRFAVTGNDTLRDHYDFAWLDGRTDRLYFGAGDYLLSAPAEDVSAYRVELAKSVNYKARMVALPGGGVRLLDFYPGATTLYVRDFSPNGVAAPPLTLHLPPGQIINEALWHRRHGFLLVTDTGALQRRPGRTEWAPLAGPPELLPSEPVDGEFRGDTLVVATRQNGIYLVDLPSFTSRGPMHHVTERRVEAFSPQIERVNVDRAGVIWISTPNDGVYYCDPRGAKFRFHPPPDVAALPVVDLAQSTDGQLLTLYNET